jgi:hypothetical protein
MAIVISLQFSDATAADVTISTAGRVSIELITSDASFSNTLSVISPGVGIASSGNIALSGCKLEPAVGLAGVHILSEKQSQRGCRVDLDADTTTPGIQGFAANTTFELGMCAQTDADADCEFTWSSNPNNNSDSFDHVRTTALSPQASQLNWEDLENGGDLDFNDLIVVLRVQVDTDGDGLWDDWETSGIDTTGDGVANYNLPALGANPNRKNLFLELDFLDCSVAGGDCAAGDTHSHRPKTAAINAVIAAFANAPVTNPDGSTGITLTVDVDDAIAHQNFLALGCGNGTSFDVVKADAANFGPNNPRRFTHRYGIFAHRQAAGTTSSGCGELPGNDFIVTLGEWNTACIFRGPNGTLDTLPAGDDLSVGTVIYSGPNLTCDTTAAGDDVQSVANGAQPNNDPDGDGVDDRSVGTIQQQAGTLIHEFGHTLQLCHGGVFDPPTYTQCNLNFKPNYVSAMNYWFQIPGIPPTDPDGAGPLVGRVDYSSHILPSCIGPGVNGALNTVPGGDDTINGNFIRSGPDQTCDSNAAGDDVQIIQNGDDPALDENNLNETTGIADGTDNTQYSCPPAVGGSLFGTGIGAIDWNCDGDGGTDNSVPIDINGDGMLSTLNGWDDWRNLRYDFQATADFEDGDHETTTDIVEIDYLTHLSVPVRIEIDIKPFDPGLNSINRRGNGVVPVAICSGESVVNSVNIIDPADPAGYSGATTNVDISSITFAMGSNGAAVHLLSDAVVLGSHLTEFVDTTADGVRDTLVALDAPNCTGEPAGPDLVVHFRTRETGLTLGQVNACLTANLMDGTQIVGCDSVNVIK